MEVYFVKTEEHRGDRASSVSGQLASLEDVESVPYEASREPYDPEQEGSPFIVYGGVLASISHCPMPVVSARTWRSTVAAWI